MNINEDIKRDCNNVANSPSLLASIILKSKKHASITVVVIVLTIGVILSATYLLPMKSNQFRSPGEEAESLQRKVFSYKTINELLKDIEHYQESRKYLWLIYTLQIAVIDKLVKAELACPNPRFIVINARTPVPYGIEDANDVLIKYNFVSFPGASDSILDPGFDFWIISAIDFTRRYNVKLMSELNKTKK